MALNAEGYRNWFQDASTTGVVVAGTAATTTLDSMITVRNSSYTIYVQKIHVNTSTSHADTIIFQDDNASPKILCETIASPALGHKLVFDGGAEGVPLTEGKNLDGVAGAGPAFTVSVEAYQKLTAVLDSTAANQ